MSFDAPLAGMSPLALHAPPTSSFRVTRSRSHQHQCFSRLVRPKQARADDKPAFVPRRDGDAQSKTLSRLQTSIRSLNLNVDRSWFFKETKTCKQVSRCPSRFLKKAKPDSFGTARLQYTRVLWNSLPARFQYEQGIRLWWLTQMKPQ